MGNQPVDLRRPRIGQLAFRLLVDELCRNLTQSLDVGSPIVDAKKIQRDRSKHSPDLIGLHGSVCAKRRQNSAKPLAIMLPCVAGEVASARVRATLVWRHSENAISFSEFRQAFQKQIAPFQRRQFSFNASSCAVDAHGIASTGLSPGASRWRMARASR